MTAFAPHLQRVSRWTASRQPQCLHYIDGPNLGAGKEAS
jgi:hypothetical protein